MRVFIGYDHAEAEAARVAAKSLHEVSGLTAEFLQADRLRAVGLLTRPVDTRGEHFDMFSGARQSTEFAISRFLTPLLCQGGPALFVDCDVVFCEDPRQMVREVDGRQALYVVKHDQQPTEKTKMGGKTQTAYGRKNWSSVMLFNCDHAAHRRMSVRDVNERRGLDLHQFYWLHDDEIGDLHPRWNWLVNVEPRPVPLGIAHLTLGGPWIQGWQGGEADELWRAASAS